MISLDMRTTERIAQDPLLLSDVNTLSSDTLGQDAVSWSQPIRVSGMSCGSCEQKIGRAIHAWDPAVSVKVSARDQQVWLPEGTTPQQRDTIQQIITTLGFQVNDIHSSIDGVTDHVVVPVHTPFAIATESVPVTSQSVSDVVATVPSVQSSLEINLSVGGMTCASCVSHIEHHLRSQPGIKLARVALLAESAQVHYDPALFPDPEAIAALIRDLGFEASLVTRLPKGASNAHSSGSPARLTELVLRVSDLPCSSCVKKIEAALLAYAAVRQVSVQLADGTCRVLCNVEDMRPLAVLAAIQRAGYQATFLSSEATSTHSPVQALDKVSDRHRFRSLFLLSLIFSLPEFLVSHILPNFETYRRFAFVPCSVPGLYPVSLLEMALTLPALFMVGRGFYSSAFRSLLHGYAGMDLLIVCSTSCAVLFSLLALLYAVLCPQYFMTGPPMMFFDTSTMLLSFVLFGKYLESMAKGKTSTALAALYHLRPARCTVVSLASEQSPLEPVLEAEIPVEWLQVGDVICVRPGQKIAADGIIIDGHSTIDESLVTGEPIPVMKWIGDEVIGGSINGTVKDHASAPPLESNDDIPLMTSRLTASTVDVPSRVSSQGVLFVKCIRVGEDSALSRIIKMVESAQMSKPPIQSFADTISGVFVPVVLVLAIFTFIAWFAILRSYDMTNKSVVSMLLASTSVSSMFGDGVSSGERSSHVPVFALVLLALKISISVVVVACPCALGLATPTAVMVGTGLAAQRGILIKNGNSLELSEQIGHLIFDKTGTLTRGRLSVSECLTSLSAAGSREHRDILLFSILGAAELHSDHPLAKAIVSYAFEISKCRGAFQGIAIKGEQLTSLFPTLSGSPDTEFSVDCVNLSFESCNGLGVTGVVKVSCRSSSIVVTQDRFRVLVGNEELVRSNGVDVAWMTANDSRNFFSSHTSSGDSMVYFVIQRILDLAEKSCVNIQPITGIIALSDSVNSEVPEAVRLIQQRLGIEVYMVTGDHWDTAKTIANLCGIPESNVFAGVSPGGKKLLVEALQEGRIGQYRGGVLNRSHMASASHSELKIPKPSLFHRFASLFFRRFPYSTVESQRAVVAMVGDGINDSPALAQADVGFALCTGTDVAIEAADVVIMNRRTELLSQAWNMEDHDRNLILVPIAIDMSRYIYNRIRWNFFWATSYNVMALPVAMGFLIPVGIMLHPILAAAMMAFSSVSVVLNSLSLRFYDPKRIRTPMVMMKSRMDDDGQVDPIRIHL